MSLVEPSRAIEVAPIEDSSLLAFYRDMNLPERRTFWACASGWALDGLDFMIYPLVIGTIIALWKVDPGTAGLAGTVTLLAYASGALPALFVFFLRRYVEEPLIAAEARAKQAASGNRPALWDIFSGPILKT